MFSYGAVYMKSTYGNTKIKCFLSVIKHNKMTSMATVRGLNKKKNVLEDYFQILIKEYNVDNGQEIN